MRPVVIAHRGASGHLPEHTLQAKALAYAMGADYLEQDIVATRDDRLVVLHDIYLEHVTDVATKFGDRARADGHYYVRDFDLDEVLTLTVHERTDALGRQVFPERAAYTGAEFRVHTLERELALAATLRQRAGRPVGIYPEIKSPAWHRGEGVDITVLVLRTLAEFGYDSPDSPAYLQCFDEGELRRVRHELGTELKLVQLIGEDHWDPEETDFAAMRTPAGIARLAATVDGIGPWVNQLYRVSGQDGRALPGDLVSLAHDNGLVVHPYTFRRDALPPGFDTFEALLRFFTHEIPVDGLFTDFPGEVMKILRRIF
jgi:glycerophosphoryl diester phosphodiesterase